MARNQRSKTPEEIELRNSWGTPRKLFEQLHSEYRFTVDCCALPWNAKLPRFWTPEVDGLAQSWAGERVWDNPPYTDIPTWLKKASEEAVRGACSVHLLPVRSDQEWWHEFVIQHGEVHYFRGCLRCEPPEGIKASSNWEPTCLVLLGPWADPTRVLWRHHETGRILAACHGAPSALHADIGRLLGVSCG